MEKLKIVVFLVEHTIFILGTVVYTKYQGTRRKWTPKSGRFFSTLMPFKLSLSSECD